MLYGFEHDYEGCEQIIEDLYDFALDNRIPEVFVDDALRQGYWNHKARYESARKLEGLDRDVRIHCIDVHVLQDHVMSKLEKAASEDLRNERP